jgi:hypothetical protein
MTVRISVCLLLWLTCVAAYVQGADPFNECLTQKEPIADLQDVSKTWIWKDDELVGADFAVRVKGRTVEIRDLRVLQKRAPRLKTLFIPEWANATDAWAKEVATFRSLETLGLCSSELTDEGLSHLAKLPLKHVSLSGCTLVTNKAMETVADWEQLESLNLAELSGLTDEDIHTIRGLAKLHTLHLRGTEVTNESVKVLEAFTKLKVLGISFTHIDRDAYEKLQSVLPECEVTWVPR